MDGTKQVLGLWIEQNEGARFWLKVMNELKGRGMLDCLIAVVDGLKGFPQAIRSAFPEAGVQTCIVHLMRRGLSLCSFYVRGVPEKGLASRTSDPLSSVPQVAQATAAAGNRSLPSAVRGGGRRGLANPLRPRRAGPSGPRTEGPCGSLVGPPHPFLRDLNGSVGTDPNRKRTGTQE